MSRLRRTNQHRLQEGKTSDEINAMSNEELAQELAKDGVAPDAQGMDTAKQPRRVNCRVMSEDQLGGSLGDNDRSGLKKRERAARRDQRSRPIN